MQISEYWHNVCGEKYSNWSFVVTHALCVTARPFHGCAISVEGLVIGSLWTSWCRSWVFVSACLFVCAFACLFLCPFVCV